VTRVSTGLSVPSLIAGVGGELVFTQTDRSAFVDARTWPPRVTARDFYAGHAARAPNGRWLVHGSPDPGIKTTWWLREYASLTAAMPEREEPEPVPERDLAVFAAGLEETSRRIELAHVQRIESLHVCGDAAIAVPRHVGFGERRHPYVRRRDGWREETALPPFTKTEHPARCPTACTRLSDGTDVLIWDGQVFAWDGETFARLFEHRLDLPWFQDREPVPARDGGLYSLDGKALVELRRDGEVRAHLPGVSLSGVVAGPRGTLIVSAGGQELYDPADDSVAALPEELIGKRGEIVGFTDDGALVVLDRRGYQLHPIAASDLAALPRRRASVEPVIVPPPPLPALDELGAASRTIVAAAGERIVLAYGREVRVHTQDAATSRSASSHPIVALALVGDHVAWLDLKGRLHLDHWTSHDLENHADAPRALIATPSGELIALFARSAWRTGRDELLLRWHAPLGLAGVLAAAADPDDDTLLFACEDHRLAYWHDGALIDLPPSAEQIVGVAALGDHRFACAGERNLFLLDVDHGELDALYQTCGAPFVAASATRLAWCTSPRLVSCGELRGDALDNIVQCAYPSTYSEPEDEPLAVRGLAFATDDRLVVALDRGRGNILDYARESALKLDPHDGDPRSRWVFVFGGRMLVAG
jgi:hypothetical protein